jgi:hypothetical protein
VAWTAPITFVTGSQLLAAQLNTYLRDNSNFLFDPPMCLAQSTANLSVTTGGTGTIVPFAAADIYDTDTMHDNAGAPTLITPKTAGVFFWTADVQFAGNATGSRWMQISNSAVQNPIITHQSELGPSGNPCRLSASGFWPLNAAAIAAVTSFGVFVFQSSGANLTLTGVTGGAPCYFAARWCGPYP